MRKEKQEKIRKMKQYNIALRDLILSVHEYNFGDYQISVDCIGNHNHNHNQK